MYVMKLSVLQDTCCHQNARVSLDRYKPWNIPRMGNNLIISSNCLKMAFEYSKKVHQRFFYKDLSGFYVSILYIIFLKRERKREAIRYFKIVKLLYTPKMVVG